MDITEEGVIKEFPDLENNPLWKEEAIKRFKEHIKSLRTERDKADYIINDLKKYGYIPKKMQQSGRRPEYIR